MRLSLKLAFIILITFIFSTAFVSLVVYFSTRDATERSISEQYTATVKKQMMTVDRTLYERYGDIQAFATHLEFLDVFAKQSPGTDILAKARQRLSLLKVLYGSWSELSLITLQGKIVASTNQKYEGVELTQQKYNDALLFSKAAHGDVIVTNVFIEEMTKVPTMAFLAPIRSSDGRIIGVIDGYFSWNVVLELLQEQDETTIYLTNSQGLIIASSSEGDRRNLFTKTYQNTQILSAALQKKSGSAIISDRATSEKTFVVYTYEKGYLDYQGNNWILISQLPERRVFAAAEQTAITTVFILIGIIFVTMVIIISFMFLQVSRPIHILTNAVVAISSGDLSKRITTKSHDELGILASAFNIMADKLQAMYGQLKGSNSTLEDEVAKRTTELQQKLEELERFQKLTVDREVKMVELKKRIAELEKTTVV